MPNDAPPRRLQSTSSLTSAALTSLLRCKAVRVQPLLLVRRVTGRGRGDVTRWIGPPVLVAGAWLVFSALHDGSGGMMTRTLTAFAQGVRNGDLHLEAFFMIARRIVHLALTPSVFGVLLPAALFLLARHVRQLRPRQIPSAAYLGAAFFAAGVGLVSFFYLSSYAGDMAFFLVTTLDRMSLPALVLLTAWAVLSTGSSQGPSRHSDELNPQG